MKDSNVDCRSFHTKIRLLVQVAAPIPTIEAVIVLGGNVVDVIVSFRKFVVVDYKIARSDGEESQFGQINIPGGDQKAFHIVNKFRLK
jgi:hypothetical protein